MFRVALISRWHPHSYKNDQRYVKDLLSQPDCTVSCVYDADDTIAREWAEEYSVPYSTDLEAVISRDDVDGIIVTSDPKDHKRIYELAVKYKKHVFSEKVLSFDLDEARYLRDMIKQSGIKFCIAFTRISAKQLVYAKELLDSGALGEIAFFRCICGSAMGVRGELPDHWLDPDMGGGAMMDMGFNAAYLARHIVGDFVSVSSSFNHSILKEKGEDSASCNVTFKNGAMGLIDATYATPMMSVFELSVYGTKGAYFARFGGAACAQLKLDGQPFVELDIKELPAAPLPPVVQWVRACTLGESDEVCGIDAAYDMVKYMVAAYESHRQGGKRIAIN